MSGASQSVELGLFLAPDAAEYGALREQARIADEAGIELMGIQDHPYQPRFLDTFAVIGDLLARTERLRLFPAVASLPLRHPAMLAKLSASLDVMSAGRFELGLGAGAFWDAIAAMGGPRRTPKESVDALEEAIGIVRRAWSGERSVASDGTHYPLGGYHPGPMPAHRIGIWLGSYKPRMLRLTGALADGWVPTSPYAAPEEIPDMQRQIDDAARAAGREPAAVRRIYVVAGEITSGPARGRFSGPPEHWARELSELGRELGLDTLIFWPNDHDVSEQVRRFVTEVGPAVRERTRV
jgi:alkanesulfonate monooxygenase SsuD/methylene tetrahydromethanopterin reductase-like flavin-dependent oxidoreductase (luciferase family)